jgi:hypothetical protein
MYANRAMRQIMVHGQRVVATLPPELAVILSSGVEVKDGCTITRAHPVLPFSALRHSVEDLTGYECFANHFHFTQPSPATGLCQAQEFCKRMALILREMNPAASFRFIVSNSGNEWTVRFHMLRPQESWVSSDLDGYRSEAVLVMDSVELTPLSDNWR